MPSGMSLSIETAGLSRLDLEALRASLADPGVDCVLARHPARLLSRLGPDALAELAPALSWSERVHLSEAYGRVGAALGRMGLRPSRAREILLAEISHLVRGLGCLANDLSPEVHLDLAEAGDELLPAPSALPQGLALVYGFPVPSGGQGTRPSPSGRMTSGSPLPPATAAVLRPSPAAPRLVAAPPEGCRLLVLRVASGHGCRGPEDWPRLAGTGPADVVLATMPFAPFTQPSLGLELLKRALPAGTARVLYPAVVFAARIGTPLYLWIADLHPTGSTLLGEWMFRHALFPELPDDADRFAGEVLLRPTSAWLASGSDAPLLSTLVPEAVVEDLLQARSLVDGFLDHCAAEILACRPRIVGLTSVFQQHVASLALARRIKRLAPDVRIVLGGANCEGEMGLATVRLFGDVDAVVSGEGEVVLPQIVERWLADRPLDGLRGVYTRDSPEVSERVSHPPNSPSPRLDALPWPDFGDFFEQYERSGLAASCPPVLLFETSRGCWWGERRHCTFCGLNGETMAYRSKPPERALAELKELTRRHPGLPVSVVDNILDLRYLETFLPRLAEELPGLDLFYEVKSNLRKEDVLQLRKAGVTRIQPGIESLSDEVLRLMGKGVSAIQNIRLLKSCQELEVWPLWNLIWGFPGEPPGEYARMAELLPLLYHLPPPSAMSRIFLERFSPNFFRGEESGLTRVRPAPAYGRVYPFPEEDLAGLAYVFDYEHRDGRDVDEYTQTVRQRVIEWQEAYPESRLIAIDRGDHLLVCDTRPSARQPLTVLSGPARSLLLACDGIAGVEQLRGVAGGASRSQVEEALEPLLAQGFVVRRGDAVLALTLPGSLGGGPGLTH